MPGRIDNVDGIIDSRTYSNTEGNEMNNKGYFSLEVPKLEPKPKYGGKKHLKKRSYTRKIWHSERKKALHRSKTRKIITFFGE